jgi:LacI family transcriptional regulator
MQKPIGPSSGPSPRTVTIKDVAREAEVSITTVSNVLNGHIGAMSAATLDRVTATISALGYRPSSVARSLVTGRAATIAVVLAGRAASSLFPAVATIEELAGNAGYGLGLLLARDAELSGKRAALLHAREVAGVVIISASGETLGDEPRPFLESSIPVVLLNGNVGVGDTMQVAWDDAGGVSGAVGHLVELGHRRIAFLGDPAEPQSTEARRQGYLGAMASHGIRPREEWVRECALDAPRERWRKTLTELVSAPPRPTAAVAAADAVAAVAMRELQRMGVRVPADFAMIGVGGSDYCSLLSPALTTVRLPVEEAGRCAAEMLLEMIAGGGTGGQRVLIPCPLIVRESCGSGARPGAAPSDKPAQQRPLW